MTAQCSSETMKVRRQLGKLFQILKKNLPDTKVKLSFLDMEKMKQ